LFVNLRCMVVIDQKAFIFAGGGITSGSDAGAEWQETNLKADTLLRIIEQQS
jgi:isochorismate synthase